MMIKKTVPIEQPHQGRGPARGETEDPNVDPNSETLAGLTPPPASLADTHPQGMDQTCVEDQPAGGRSMVPSGPPPVTAAAPEDQATLPGLPNDATLDGVDSATRAYHQDAIKGAPKAAVTTGASFGHYELIEPIAKGGMGIVYKARQRNLNRIVAIKMILAGQFADQTDVDRFYAEAEAAAALSHPNIVGIHEIGEVQGQHFFSMDYIEGQSLADLVRENPLRPRRAAEFVRTIAETMQFAHENGVVHRDLKPANVLLDKRQRPLITDFGLAKQVSSQSQRTMAGSIVGTPSYMPPEQASGQVDKIGPWSDLYSTGAILYELLTGRPPFRSASPFETVRQVIETEPLSPRLLNENVPKDLETICLKCLQKEPAKRYATEQELAEELTRFLNGEPIHARPISQFARLWRLCRRNPVTATAIATAAIFFITAFVTFTVAYFTTSAALRRETAAKAQSDQSFREAVGAVNELFTVVSEDTLLNQPGMQPVREKLLTKAKEYFERFSKQRENDLTVESELAGAYFRLGRVAAMLQSPNEALKPYRKARDIQQRLLAQDAEDPARIEALGDTVNFMGRALASLNDFDGALREFDEAIKLRTQLTSMSRDDSEYQRALANAHMNVGFIHRSTHDFDKARREFEDAQQIRQKASQAAAGPELRAKVARDLGQGYSALAILDVEEKQFAAAQQHYKSASAMFEQLADEYPEDLENQKNLALVYRGLGDVMASPDDARSWYDKAAARLQLLSDQNPKVGEYPMEWAIVLANTFAMELKAGNAPRAKAALERARDILAPLAERFPTPRCQSLRVDMLRELASLQNDGGDAETAVKTLTDALRIARSLAQQYGQEQFVLLEASTLRQLGTLQLGVHEYAAAKEHLVQSVALFRQLAQRRPDAAHQFEVALTLRALADAQQAGGDQKDALEGLKEVIQTLDQLVKEFPDDAEFKEQLDDAKKAALALSSPDSSQR